MAKKTQVICLAKCAGGYIGRQYDLTEGQVARIFGPTRALVERYGGQRCSYCGAVYGKGFRLLGYLDNGLVGESWLPHTPK